MKTFIAIPSMESVPTKFAMALAKLRRAGDTMIGNIEGSLVYNARNDLARLAIQSEADQILWLDSDMVFDPDLLERMTKVTEENDIDFLTGLCFRRKPPYTPTIFERLDYRPEEKKCIHTQFLSVPKGLFKVEGCGFAGVLMKTDVILSVASRFDGRMFDPLDGMGEDISFCWRARECGYDIWCDPTIELGHVGQTVVTRQYFEAFKGD